MPKRDLADLVEQQGAPAGLLESPLPLAVGAGEGASLVAEELAFQQVFRERGAVDLDQAAGPGGVAEMDGLGHQLLAGPRLAGDQDRAGRRGDPLDAGEDLHHLPAPSQQVVVGVAPAEPVAQVGDLVDQAAILEGLVDQQLQPLGVDRLLDEIMGTQLHGLDGRLDRGVGRHDDRRHRQVAVANLADQVEPADPGQPQVGDDERIRPLDQPFQGGRPLAGHADLPIGSGEKLGKLLADQLAVIHHEDASIHGALIQVEEVRTIRSPHGRVADPRSAARVHGFRRKKSIFSSVLGYGDFPDCQAYFIRPERHGPPISRFHQSFTVVHLACRS